MAPNDEPQGFQFVTVTQPGHNWKNRNEHIVRSHVMRQVRRNQKLKVNEEATKLGLCGKRRIGRNGSAEVCYCQRFHRNESSKIREDPQPSNVLWTGGQKNFSYQKDVCIACARQLGRDQWPLEQLTLSHPRLSAKDQRLLKHISNFFSPIVANIGHRFFLWTKGIIMFMAVAESHEFLMHALLGWSATHLAPVFSDKEMELDSYRHRDRALRGLQEAILCFSKDNADAVLCASIVMSWQSSDARSWASLMRGCESVKAKMATLKKESCLDTGGTKDSLHMEPNNLFDAKFPENTPLFHSQSPEARNSMAKECIHSLALLQDSLVDMPDLTKGITELTALLRNLQDPNYPARFKTRHERLRPLKDMVYWFPRRFLPRLSSHPSAMLLMAHLHACALFIEPAEDSDSACFRRLNASPIQAFYEEFSVNAELELKAGELVGIYQKALVLLQFPLKVVAEFQSRLKSFYVEGHYAEIPETSAVKLGENEDRFGRRDISTLTVLENFPVGLWHNSLV